MKPRIPTAEDVRPDKILLYGVKGWGKTTLGAFAPSPVFLLGRGETGYLTLVRNKMVPPSPFVITNTWHDTIKQLSEFAAGMDGETLVMDSLGEFERMCYEDICASKFKSDWAEFMAYARGVAMSVMAINQMTQLLDQINAKGKRIIVLAHSKVKHFDNPLGAGYDRYICDCNERTWEPLNGWADAVLFGKFRTITAKVDGEVKGVGGDERMLFTRYCDAYEAKNRHNLPEQIDVGKDASKMWQILGTKLAAAVAGQSVAVPPAEKPKPEPAPGVEGDKLLMELQLLINTHQLTKYVPALCKQNGVKKLEDMTMDQLVDVIARIRAKFAEVQAGK